MSGYDVKARLGVSLGNWVTAFNRAKRASNDFYRSIKRQDFSSIKNQGRVIQDFGRRATATFGSVALASAAGMGKMIKTSASYESAFAGVRKTTEMTDKGYRKLDKTFRQMSRTMPATYEEIAAVGEIAGQLGVEEKNLASFTKTMIMMGTATNMSSEEAATSIARFANIMDMPLSKAENLGSTIVELGNNSATTEAEIVELGLRIAASGRMAGMSEADVMALSTSMSSLGIEAEAGGTAMSMTLNKMNSDLSEGGEAAKQWADVAGMSVSEFQRAFEEDAYGATVLFLEGLRDIDESGGDVNAVLKEMGINGIRQQDVIKRLMYSTEDMTNYQKMANDEFKNSSALVEEAGERYKTFDSQVIMAWNSIRNISATLGTTFKNALAGLMSGIMPAIHAIEDFTDGLIDAEGNLTPLGQIIGKVGVAFVGFMTILTGLMAVVWVVGGTIAAFGAI
ncbi:MAG TPA: phage tail tape measure protein, partial [Massilibacterium sp.]|nr:phage tail tape measure protein [Massilibacterium sp.]